jgi:ATP-dependent Lhr-like helicase
MKTCEGRVRNLHIHHSSLSHPIRKLAEEAFLSEDGACIICTSTLELGIDIGDLDVVVQVGPPNSVSSFLQRMGRSGRRGKAASLAWILESPCELLCSVAIIECAINREVEVLVPLQKPFNVLLQQVFLTLHTISRTTRRQLAMDLLRAPVFCGIDPATLERILDHLTVTGYILKDGEMIMSGPEAERIFGRSNGKDLYSVIRGGGEYRAVTPEGEVVGKLDARFVNSSGSSEISLGGRTWSMVKCDEGHNLVVVVPSGSASSRIFWTGTDSAGFSSLVCQRVQQICSKGASSLPLGRREHELVDLALARFPEGIGPGGLYLREDAEKKGDVLVVSLQGIGFNQILALLLRHLLGNKAEVQHNDFLLKVTRAGKETAGLRVAAAVCKIMEMNQEEIGIILPLPPKENWKFAQVLPEALFREMAISDHYHVEEFLAIMKNITVSVLNPR